MTTSHGLAFVDEILGMYGEYSVAGVGCMIRPDMIWITIPSNFNYEISEHGSVRRLTDSKTRKAGTLLRASPDKDGYLGVSLTLEGTRTRRRISRLVCEAFHGYPQSETDHAAHGDGDICNNHYRNLRWATVQQNTADKLRHGTIKRGEAQYHAKLNEAAVREIRREPAVGHYRVALAAKFGVSVETIASVRGGRSWSHVHG